MLPSTFVVRFRGGLGMPLLGDTGREGLPATMSATQVVSSSTGSSASSGDSSVAWGTTAPSHCDLHLGLTGSVKSSDIRLEDLRAEASRLLCSLICGLNVRFGLSASGGGRLLMDSVVIVLWVTANQI